MLKRISLCALSALLLAAPFLFPPLFPLAWVAFVPLFWVVYQAESLRHGVYVGWLAGFLTHLIGFYWLVHTISVFGGFPYPISAVVFLIYAALQGLQMALFALLVKRFGYGPLCLFPPLYWIVIEFWFPLLFPWYLANSQILFASFIQTADLIGPYAASLIIMWFNAALYHVHLSSQQSGQIRWRPVLMVALFVIASVIYGLIRLAAVSKEMQAAAKLTIAAVQGNIDIDLKWNPVQAQHNLQAHQRLTEQGSGAALIIWPESAVEFWLPDDLQQLPPEVVPSLNSENSYFMFGAKSFLGNIGGPNFKAFNTAFFANARGRVLDRYHKQVLLAFGEYLPFAGLLSKLPGIPFADGFTPGEGPRTFNLSGSARLAPLICYEDLMPELSRSFVKETKANLLVNLTNDAWYGRTVAPWQHARVAQWRAIETRRTLLRVTNTGITSVINAKGEMVEALPIFAPGVLKAQVEILEGETLYVRFGDWFAWTATFVVLGIVLLGLRRYAAKRDSV
jgi:apolipoprotein N-acyltransferase